jgi:glycosyltransferase involved in cell wall biosynthesis
MGVGVWNKASLIVGIDASNIRAGGGVTHLVELLRAANPIEHGFSQVIVWSGQATLSRIEDRPWLVKSHQPLLDKGLPHRIFWQRFKLSMLAREAECNVLFVPGGSSACNFQPTVAMSQNLLPFAWREIGRYGWSWFTLKMMLLRLTQSHSFRQAHGLIFLTQYAKDVVMQIIKPFSGEAIVVPHGINDRFFCPPQEQLSIDRYSVDRPFQMLYVSIVDMYKHQWQVAEAVTWLGQCGLPVRMELIGPAYPPALKRLRQTLDRIDPDGEFVRYSGAVPHPELHVRYDNADLCVFASSCENMPNILLEAMAAGLPIACSNRGPMPEMLGDDGVYFDPENPRDIARALRELIDSPELRAGKARASSERVKTYSWERCARDTFRFLARMASSSGSRSAMVDVA